MTRPNNPEHDSNQQSKQEDWHIPSKPTQPPEKFDMDGVYKIADFLEKVRLFLSHLLDENDPEDENLISTLTIWEKRAIDLIAESDYPEMIVAGFRLDSDGVARVQFGISVDTDSPDTNST